MKYFLLLLFLVSLQAFALPCPNGRGILYKNDTIATVLSQCGEPNSKNTYIKSLNNQQQWTYNKGHAYDPGFTQLIFTFNNDRVSNIYVNDLYWLPICRQVLLQVGAVTTTQTSCGNMAYNTSFTALCGTGIGIGASSQDVLSICGLPNSQTNSQANSIEVTEFYYTGDHSQTIVFENGHITDFK